MLLKRSLTALVVSLVLTAVAAAAPMKALIVDGQNNHDWKATTPILKKELEDTGLFAVDVATAPAAGQDMSGFQPDFAAYKVVVSNYNGDDWPEATKRRWRITWPAAAGWSAITRPTIPFPNGRRSTK